MSSKLIQMCVALLGRRRLVNAYVEMRFKLIRKKYNEIIVRKTRQRLAYVAVLRTSNQKNN